MRCPKCSNPNMSGPFYKSLYGSEFLTYECRCGYKKNKPTHDNNGNISSYINSSQLLHQILRKQG